MNKEPVSNDLSFVFDGILMPPSSNKAYNSFVRGGRIRHVCAPELVNFKRSFGVYCLLNRALFRVAREGIAGVKSPRLWVNCDFYFLQSQLYTKDERLKRLDVSNRLKALHDCMAEALGIDDSLFMEIKATKQVATVASCRVEIGFL